MRCVPVLVYGGIALLCTVSSSHAATVVGEGFSRQISYERGTLASFSFRGNVVSADVYRMGGQGPIGTLVGHFPVAHTTQPNCLKLQNGSADCGNWTISGSWRIPADAQSSIYKVVPRSSGGAAGSPVWFVVRCDECKAPILVVTSDATWQAYNPYGGGSLYYGNNPLDPAKGREYRVSYNRPLEFSWSYPTNQESALTDWLTENGYRYSYAAQTDLDRNPTIAAGHKVIMAVGHLEYVSPAERSAFQYGISHGISFADMTGNSFYWKTQISPSIDAAHSPDQTIVCYKETLNNADINPSTIWTGTWRDRRFSPPNDGGQPENTLTGQLSTVDSQSRADSIHFTAQEAHSPFLRNSNIANLPVGHVATMPAGTLGYEWDEVASDDLHLPPGEITLSTSVVPNVTKLVPNWADDYSRLIHASGVAGYHQVTLYHTTSGAWVWTTGTIQWTWGLSNTHARYTHPTANEPMQQATANILDDMGVTPQTPQPGITITPPRPFSAYTSALSLAKPVD